MKLEVINLKEIYPFLSENGCNPTLTAYLPYNDFKETEVSNRPCMLVIPGGGYGFCSDREAEPFALRFAALGFNAFVLKYSVAPNRFPTQLLEVAAAMDLIHKKADEWGSDPDKTAIIGFSAGGHLSAHYSTSFDIPAVREKFPESYPVNATILCYPVISGGEKAHRGSFNNLLGENRKDDEKWLEYLSLENRVSQKTPRTFLWHTYEDNAVPVENSLYFVSQLRKCGAEAELHIFNKGPHGIATANKETNKVDFPRRTQSWLDMTCDWILE